MARTFNAQYAKISHLSVDLLDVSGHFLPAASGNLDLGSGSFPFRDLYIKEDIKISGQTIDVGNNRLRFNNEEIITNSNITGYLVSGSGIGFNNANFIADGAQTIYSVSGSIESIDNILVSIDGLLQRPRTDFTIASNNIVFNEAPADDSIILIKNLKGTAPAAFLSATCAGATYDACDEMTRILLAASFN